MKMVCTEVTLDKKRLIFYFTADGRIDFRELVKDLAARFRTRIEMRQVGVRDAAKVVGGLGICGRQLCCKTFLTSFEPISIRMAKSQELVLNANKLSGVCGRLMCCLSYEYSETEKIGDVAPEKAELPLLEEEGKIKSEVSQELSPSAEERPSERAKDRGRRRRYGSARPPAGEGEAKKSSGGQASQAGREDRRHKAVQGPPRDESQPVKAEPTAPQGESHDQQFQRRKRHGRRFRR
jgi:hypothetical protein